MRSQLLSLQSRSTALPLLSTPPHSNQLCRYANWCAMRDTCIYTSAQITIMGAPRRAYVRADGSPLSAIFAPIRLNVQANLQSAVTRTHLTPRYKLRKGAFNLGNNSRANVKIAEGKRKRSWRRDRRSAHWKGKVILLREGKKVQIASFRHFQAINNNNRNQQQRVVPSMAPFSGSTTIICVAPLEGGPARVARSRRGESWTARIEGTPSEINRQSLSDFGNEEILEEIISRHWRAKVPKWNAFPYAWFISFSFASEGVPPRRNYTN